MIAIAAREIAKREQRIEQLEREVERLGNIYARDR